MPTDKASGATIHFSMRARGRFRWGNHSCKSQVKCLHFESMAAGSSPTSEILAPPGAGLPKLELFFARLMVAWLQKTKSRAEMTAIFHEELEEILRLAGPLDSEVGARRILVKRLRGMEDSSRDWSVFMTLEHLRIVNEGMRGCILSLAKGKVPPRVASTAAVKPPPDADASALAAFQEGCTAFLEGVAAIPDLKTSSRYAHPWFGPMDAAGWHAVAASHMRLHRKQIEAILAGLNG